MAHRPGRIAARTSPPPPTHAEEAGGYPPPPRYRLKMSMKLIVPLKRA
jgi:hypothetical protein